MSQHRSISAVPDDHAGTWANTVTSRPRGLDRPGDVSRPESVEEVSRWAGSADLRRTQFVHAPVFSLVWVGIVIWLFIAIGVFLSQLSVLRDLRVEKEWIFEQGVAHSIHRASVDYNDGEDNWATYIALDHRLDDQQAARIHAAFEQWVSDAGVPPARSELISSQALFGAQAAGGYFILHLPVSTVAGATTDHAWMLIPEPQDNESDGIVTPVPVPVPKKHARIRRRLRRQTERRGAS